jgi:capsular exopolysaccharide synthesis family protein
MNKNEVVRLIGFNEFIYIIAKRKIIMIVITLISVLTAGYISFFMTSPVYQSQASVIVDKKGDSPSNENVQYDDVMMYQNLVKTYANIGSSDRIYAEASEKLNNSVPPDMIAKRVSVAPIEDTQMLTVSAQGESPKEALNLLKAVTNSFIEVSNSVYPAGDIRIVSDGKLPESPIKPNKRFNITVGFLIGIIFSIIIIFLLDYFDDKIKNIEDVKRNFSLPILGDIQMEEKIKGKQRELLIFKNSPESFVSQSYRILSTNIQSLGFDTNMKTILITSSSSSEGKSIISSNLALAIAEAGNKVLLLDCDLRMSSIHKKFNLSNQKGLSNLLIEKCKFEEVVQKYNNNLYILTSGEMCKNPSKNLSSIEMNRFLQEAKKLFDYIILDTPPVVCSSEAQILSKFVNGVLLVVASGQSEITKINRAIELLSHVKANVIGIVANKLKANKKDLKEYDNYYFKSIKDKKISISQ